MRYAIRYLTEYAYDAPVSDNLNALRVTPAATPTQRLDDFGVRVAPEVRLHRHIDYFGTRVIEFGVTRPHEQLSIDVRARVLTEPPAAPPEEPWSALEDPHYAQTGAEFLLPIAAEPEDPVLDTLLGDSSAPTPLQTVARLCRLIPDTFRYRTGVTYVGSTVADLLAAGGGVCQDFAHLALALVRRRGIAARYVSGYLYAASAEDPEGASAEVQTHAWIEVLLPRAGGEPVWVGFDPTNRGPSGEAHVKIGHGRAYADVPPVKGVFRGAAGARLETAVHMTRAGRPAAAGDVGARGAQDGA